jgi:hypothetical protein
MRRFASVFITVLLLSVMLNATAYRLIILTTPALAEGLGEFIDHKNKSGYPVALLTTTSTNATTNKEIIRTFWNSCDYKPEFLLIVGNFYVIPPGYQSDASSDCFFSDFDGDNRNDIYPGRFPCANLNELATIVSRQSSMKEIRLLTEILTGF